MPPVRSAAASEAEVQVTPQLAAEHGLTAEEYARIQKILGRDPSFTELGVFSVMWSEHCSYKSSRIHLKKLPTKAPQVLQGPGENAGVVDVGDGFCAVFKIESHNHPSYVEPFQGAATGVGGILRDIFTMGARPIAVLDSLRFGAIATRSGASPLQGGGAYDPAKDRHPESRRTVAGEGSLRAAPTSSAPSAGALAPDDTPVLAANIRLLDGVVRGIAFYGNCFGVPTAGGEVMFEPGYAGNPLVNVLALGIAKKDQLFFARASGEGNPVIYVGAKTGRDGIHGASLLASAEFTEESQQKRPNVQVGDPFLEKLLLEACLEVMKTGAVVAIQDMGAAGLTSSSCEMASRGGVGIEIELERVPQRETGMTPYEMLLSESQERMLLVAERGRESEVFAVFKKWGLDAVEIGRVTSGGPSGGMLRVLHHGRVAAEIPAHALAEEAPVYDRPAAAPEPRLPRRSPGEGGPRAPEPRLPLAPEGADLTWNLRRLLAAPNIASKRWIFEQYDHMVRTNTLAVPGAADAAVLRLKGTPRALALSTSGNGRWCALDPRAGAMHAVAESARNVAATGARPLGATNCLNFGNPEKPEVMWQFQQAIDGIAEACRALHIPITGGNVSFYNETLGKSIDPTPVLGVLGLLEDASAALGSAFRAEDDRIVLLDGALPGGRGDSRGESPAASAAALREFCSSEYARTIHSVVAGAPPAIDLAAESRLIELLQALGRERLLNSAHDLSDGGLAGALAECCFGGAAGSAAATGLGAAVAIDSPEPAELGLFGERGARAVVSLPPANLAPVLSLAAQWNVAAREIGAVTRSSFRIQWDGRLIVDADPSSLAGEWAGALERAVLGRRPSES